MLVQVQTYMMLTLFPSVFGNSISEDRFHLPLFIMKFKVLLAISFDIRQAGGENQT